MGYFHFHGCYSPPASPPVIVCLKDPFPSLLGPSFLFLKPTADLLRLLSPTFYFWDFLSPNNWPRNTLILPMHKPYGAYHLVQDLNLINEAVIPVHPVVSNPYNFLSNFLPANSYFTVLDLKDMFFTVPLYPDSYFHFSFTWDDPDTCSFRQLTWTDLPQGFWHSPHFLGKLRIGISQTLTLVTACFSSMWMIPFSAFTHYLGPNSLLLN